MHRIDVTSASPTLPATDPVGPAGYFTKGSATTGVPATVVSQDWCNAVQEEIVYVITRAGLVLTKGDRTQLFQAIGLLTRQRLTAAATYYVSPTGNDLNNGLTAGTAWATVQYAYQYIRDRLDLNGKQVTIQLANGTHQPFTAQFPIYGPPPIILGNPADPSQVIVSGTNSYAVNATNGAMITLDSFTVQAPGGQTNVDYGGNGSGLLANAGGIIRYNRMRFGVCTAAHMSSWFGGAITPGINGATYTIAAGAPYHFACVGGTIVAADAVVTIIGAPNFTGAFATATNGASELDAWNMTFNGTATGLRYGVSNNGLIQTNGAGPNYFPGNTAGIVQTGGIYS